LSANSQAFIADSLVGFHPVEKENAMKKSLCIVLTVIFVLGLTFLTPSTAQAGWAPPTAVSSTLPDPKALPSVEDAAFTSKVIGFPDLPGTLLLDNGKFSPVGYTAGDAQFGSAGLKVSGLAKGVTVTACFPFPGYRFKWTGVVSQWNGTKWSKLVTYFPADADGVSDWACATGLSGGTYSLIIWYYGPPEPAINTIPDSVG
jgi:hypothetical protein